MKSIKLLLTTLLIFVAIGVNAQDDFYNNKPQKEKEKITYTETKKVAIEDYTTEQDYNEKHNITTTYTEYEESDDNKRKKQRSRGASVAGEIVAEIVVEVFVNALLIAAFWN